ncbi:MAG: hypothetical protein RI897_4652 [Verrucomicrobiota bacterium]
MVAAAGILRVGGVGFVVSGAVGEFFIGDDHAGHPGFLFDGGGGDLEQFGGDDAVGGIVGVHDSVDEAAAWGMAEGFGEGADGGEGTFRGASWAAFSVPFDLDGTGGLGRAVAGTGQGGGYAGGEGYGVYPGAVWGMDGWG